MKETSALCSSKTNVKLVTVSDLVVIAPFSTPTQDPRQSCLVVSLDFNRPPHLYRNAAMTMHLNSLL